MYVVVVNWQYSAATLFLSVFLSRQASMTTWNVYHNHVILCVWERRKKNMKMKLFQRMMGNSCPWRYLVHFNPQYCCDNLVFNALKGALLEGNPRVEGLKDLEGPKGLIWINLVTFQRLLYDTFKKQTSKTQGLLIHVILWSPQWFFVSCLSLSWVILLYPCGPGWKQESHGLSTRINHSEVKIWAITTEKLFLKLNYFLKNCFHLFVNFLTGRFLSRMPKNTQNL